MVQIERFGWRKDALDRRDHRYSIPTKITTIPDVVDLREKMPPVYDQGQLGSCTANAVAGAIEYDQMRQALPEITAPSRLFIYYNTRLLEHTTHSDAGGELRDAAKTVAKQGAADESLWPYDIAKFTHRPPKNCYKEGLTDKVLAYASVSQDAQTLQLALANTDTIVFGFTVYASFESDTVTTTGVVPMPQSGEDILGGHACLIVGYNRTDQTYLVRNSWGDAWGQKGYFTLPFAYVHDPQLASDFWNLQTTQ